jgi:hypothetical protein
MLRFLCDFCRREKKQGESWILGIAAENVAPTAARREVLLASTWDPKRLCHPLAVHFCSQAHAERYIASLFDQMPGEIEEEVVETTVRTAPLRRVQRRVVRTISGRKKRASSARSSRRKSA